MHSWKTWDGYDNGDLANFKMDSVDSQYTLRNQVHPINESIEKTGEIKNIHTHRNKRKGINSYLHNSEAIETSKEVEENTKDKDATVQQEHARENEQNSNNEEKKSNMHHVAYLKQSNIFELSGECDGNRFKIL